MGTLLRSPGMLSHIMKLWRMDQLNLLVCDAWRLFGLITIVFKSLSLPQADPEEERKRKRSTQVSSSVFTVKRTFMMLQLLHIHEVSNQVLASEETSNQTEAFCPYYCFACGSSPLRPASFLPLFLFKGRQNKAAMVAVRRFPLPATVVPATHVNDQTLA